MNKCSNCKYEGNEERFCPKCGDNMIISKIVEVKKVEVKPISRKVFGKKKVD